jgi:hypothetical protein
MKKRFEELQKKEEEIIYGIMKDSEQDLNDLNLEQLYSGKTNKGEDIHPSYLEDPYWNDHRFRGLPAGLQSAQAYSDFKDQITPAPLRNPGSPNLFINGFYHSRRTTLVLPGGDIVHDDSAPFGKDIQRKYKDIDGLGGRFKKIFMDEYIRPLFNERIGEVVKLKVGNP